MGIIGLAGEHPNLLTSTIRMPHSPVGAGGQWLNPAAFALPADFTLGNTPRNVGYALNQSFVTRSFFKFSISPNNTTSSSELTLLTSQIIPYSEMQSSCCEVWPLTK